MILKRKLFAKRRNLTPEQEEDRKLRDQIFREEFPKRGLSHFYTKGTTFRGGSKNSGGQYTGFDRSKEEDEEIKEKTKKAPIQGKKVSKARAKGKEGVVALDPSREFDVQVHELGHYDAIENANNSEEREIASFKGSIENPEFFHTPSDIEKLRENNYKVLKRENLANTAGLKILKNNNASKDQIDKYIKNRTESFKTYQDRDNEAEGYINQLMILKKRRKR